MDFSFFDKFLLPGYSLPPLNRLNHFPLKKAGQHSLFEGYSPFGLVLIQISSVPQECKEDVVHVLRSSEPC
mgnify:CR=1 FL=1